MPEQDVNIRKDDLYLLLDSYKNNVELSTVIMEQLRQIADSQLKLSDNWIDSLNKQRELYKALSDISKLIENHKLDFKDSGDKLTDRLTDFEKHLSVFETDQKGSFLKLGNKVNLVYIGMGTLIVSLLTIIYMLAEKLHILHDIADKIGVP